MTRKICFGLFTIILLSASLGCKGGNRTNEATAGENNLEEFENFYAKFMRDSAYQMEHIQFPLEGLPDGADSATIAENNFRWEKENWKIHKPFGEESGFVQDFSMVGEGMVIEKIVHQSKQYAMVRRFAKLGDEWYLIYYAGVNTLRKSEGVGE